MKNLYASDIIAYRKVEAIKYDKLNNKKIICDYIQAINFDNKIIFIFETVDDYNSIIEALGLFASVLVNASPLIPSENNKIVYESLHDVEYSLQGNTLKSPTVICNLNHNKLLKDIDLWYISEGNIEGSFRGDIDLDIIAKKIDKLRSISGRKETFDKYIAERDRLTKMHNNTMKKRFNNPDNDEEFLAFLGRQNDNIKKGESKHPSEQHDNVRRGESEVDYQLKWLGPDFISLEKTSKKYDKNCIVIKNKDFIDEPQEIDHIVVSDKAVYLIETKSYSGTITINSNGNWLLTSSLDGSKPVESPVSQIFRHHQLIKSILGQDFNDDDIVDIICISHQEAIIEGEENCNIPIIKYDTLCYYIQNINANKNSCYDKNKLKEMIENYMVL